MKADHSRDSSRAKYLIIETAVGSAIVHLGMSGSLRILDGDFPAARHDHVDLVMASGKRLRYNDPRRFGLGYGVRLMRAMKCSGVGA